MTALLFAAFAPASGAHARGAPESFADLADQLLPTVVNISTTQTIEGGPSQDLEELFRDFLERRGEEPPQRRRASSLGSGFIIDAEGHVLTNNQSEADRNIVAVGIVADGERVLGILYGAGASIGLAENRIFAKWLWMGVLFKPGRRA